MICSECSESHENILPRCIYHFLSIFVSEKDLDKFKTYDDLFRNDKADIFAQRIFERSLEDDKLLEKLWDENELINSSKEVCDRCGRQVHASLYRYDVNDLFDKLTNIQTKYILDYIHLKTKLDPRDIQLVIKENDQDFFYITGKIINRFDPILAKQIDTSNEALRWFQYNERGGDNYTPLLQYIIVFVLGSLMPNAIYDITKYGFLKIFKMLRLALVLNKTQKEANEKIKSTPEEKMEEIAYQSILQNLNRKQRNKIIKKIIKYESRKRIKELYRVVAR